MLKRDWKYAKSLLHGTTQLPDTRIPGLAKPYSGGIRAHHAEKELKICKITASRHHTAHRHPYSQPCKKASGHMPTSDLMAMLAGPRISAVWSEKQLKI